MPEPFGASRNGFAFLNSWPSQPAVVLPTPFGKIDIGNAGGGLCGGMVFAAVDYWHAGATCPTRRPALGQPLYDYIVARLVDSWHVPAGVVQYFQWMNLPDGDTGFSALGKQVVIDHGLSWRTIKTQWPQIKTDLDKGVPSPLGIVTVESKRPKDLGFNHQVLAYGYDVSGRSVNLRIYDPNRGQRDDVFIRFDTGAPAKATTFENNLGISRPVRGFFRPAYAPVAPPP